ncbi:MAG: ferrochelatase [Gammaproteobacteria bacterium]|nr:ferrochelatase [Gammaproteobacteria bacterium]
MRGVKFTAQENFDHAARARTGVLLANLGTPDSCRAADVRRYLKEFLWDRRVVEMPRPLWWPLLNGVILNTRPRRTARAYRKIWGDDGSPLLAISRRQQRKLQAALADTGDGDSATGAAAGDAENPPPLVELGMRYGNPSIAAALGKLRAAGMRRLLVLPLYPQYCAATTASTFDAVSAELSRWRWLPALRFVAHYHDHPAYIGALAASVRDYRRAHGRGEMLLMSFHGIPQAYFDAGDPYHCECLKTARLLAEELGLGDAEWRVSFQSRLGRAKWLQPYTDRALADLARAGVRDVQVICPGFSADCLETLEEMALANRDLFLRAGGRRYACIPCLNDGARHIRALASIARENLSGWRDRPETNADRTAQKQRATALGAGA